MDALDDPDSLWNRVIDPLTGRPHYYDKQGKPISMREMGELRFTPVEDGGKVSDYARIGEDRVGEAWVSTVWLGIDHAFYYGDADVKPLIFETLIFGGEHDQEMFRWATEEEATKGHRDIVDDLRAGLTPGWAYGGCEDDEWRPGGQ